MSIFKNAWSQPASFGSFGGGGRSGSFIFGREGRSGMSGSGGSAGRIGSGGSERPAEKPPIERFERFGRRIGDILGSRFGMPNVIAKRISERSRIISGHFGKVITGMLGKSAEISLNFQL